MVQKIAAFPQFAPAQQETQAKPAQQKDPADSFSSLLGAKQEEQPSTEKPQGAKPTDESVSSIPEEEPDKAVASNAIALSMSGLAAQFATQQAVQEQQVDTVFAVSGAELAQGADPVNPEETGMVLGSVLPQETFPDMQNVKKAAPVQASVQPLPQNSQEPTNQPVALNQQSVQVQPTAGIPVETVPADSPVETAQKFFAETSAPNTLEQSSAVKPTLVTPLQGKMEEAPPVQPPSALSGTPAQEASVLEQPAVQSYVQREMPADFRRNPSVQNNSAAGAENTVVPHGPLPDEASVQDTPVKPTFAEQFIQKEEPLPVQQQRAAAVDSTSAVKQAPVQDTAVYTTVRETPLSVQKQDNGKVDLGSGSELAAAQVKTALPYDDGNVIIPVTHEAPPMPQAPAAQQLAEQIQQSIDAGRKEFTMDLYPHDLGKVSVKLVSESGILTVEIAAANPKTQSLLLSGASEIKSLLQAEQPVQVVDASQNKQWYEEQQQQSGQDAQEQARQQQEEEQQKNRQRYESSFSTGDFLSVMQQLRAQAV